MLPAGLRSLLAAVGAGAGLLLARESGLALARAGVAEGVVKVAVGSLFGVADDAVDDQTGQTHALHINGVALYLFRLKLIFEPCYLVARVEGGLDGGLELRQRHPAERLVRRERIPPLDDVVELLKRDFRLAHEGLSPE